MSATPCEHEFLDEYSRCWRCDEVTYRDIYGWFGDEPLDWLDDDIPGS